MQYGLAFSYFVQRKGGFANLMLVTVCLLIPVIGPIVLLGYQSEVTQSLLLDGELRRHKKFDFNRFTDYLSRGVWPFLMRLVVGVVAIPLVMIAIIVPILIGIFAELPMVGMIVGMVFYFLAIMLMVAFSAMMAFHAELSGRFEFGGAFRFAKEFLKTVGGLAVLTGFCFFWLSFFVTLLGLLCLFVGVYPATALSHMAGQHMMVQLYVEYLERGGEPIRLYDPRDEYDDDEYEDEVEDDQPRRRRP